MLRVTLYPPAAQPLVLRREDPLSLERYTVLVGRRAIGWINVSCGTLNAAVIVDVKAVYSRPITGWELLTPEERAVELPAAYCEMRRWLWTQYGVRLSPRYILSYWGSS